MGEVFSARLRKIGTSVGVLVPKEHLKDLGVDVGDEVEVALLKHRKLREIREGLGMARHFKEPFERDRKTREF